MSSKSKASDPREPLISMRIAFLRPHAKRVASNVPMAPPAKRAMNTAASSTVTGPRSAPAERGPVTVDDAAVFMARFAGGAIGTFEATRFAWGRKNAIRIEINGSRGSLAFDFEDMNVLHYFDATEGSRLGGFRRIVV